jgi:hypothetical protein
MDNKVEKYCENNETDNNETIVINKDIKMVFTMYMLSFSFSLSKKKIFIAFDIFNSIIIDVIIMNVLNVATKPDSEGDKYLVNIGNNKKGIALLITSVSV